MALSLSDRKAQSDFLSRATLVFVHTWVRVSGHSGEWVGQTLAVTAWDVIRGEPHICLWDGWTATDWHSINSCDAMGVKRERSGY